MATHRSCDGCGVPESLKMPLKEIGTIQKREYCATCAPIAEQYIEDRDKLHDRVAAEWREGIALLQASVTASYPAMRLPDVG